MLCMAMYLCVVNELFCVPILVVAQYNIASDYKEIVEAMTY